MLIQTLNVVFNKPLQEGKRGSPQYKDYCVCFAKINVYVENQDNVKI